MCHTYVLSVLKASNGFPKSNFRGFKRKH